jgi:hypothetical protein
MYGIKAGISLILPNLYNAVACVNTGPERGPASMQAFHNGLDHIFKRTG